MLVQCQMIRRDSLMKYIKKIYYKHKRIVIFISYFAACMAIFPLMTDIGWLNHFFGKEVMFVVDFLLSGWIAYDMSKGGEW